MAGEMVNIAARMKELREICDYSVEELAELMEISPITYEEYESGKTDIPISVLLNMASVCKVEPAALLTGHEPKLHTYCLTRAGEGVGVERRKEYTSQSLAYNFGNKIAEPFFVTAGVEPLGTPVVVNAHEGQEFDYVLEGTLRLLINGTELLLNAGDSIYFNAHYPHGMQSVGGKPTKFIAVVL